MELVKVIHEGNGYKIEPGPSLWVLILALLLPLFVHIWRGRGRLRITKATIDLPGGVKLEVEVDERERQAAWALYVELKTRIATQRLIGGDDKIALDSLHSLYETSRALLKTAVPEIAHGGDKSFAEIAIDVLNGRLRELTATWHVRLNADGKLSDRDHAEFRIQLLALQGELNSLANQLAGLVMRSKRVTFPRTSRKAPATLPLAESSLRPQLQNLSRSAPSPHEEISQTVRPEPH